MPRRSSTGLSGLQTDDASEAPAIDHLLATRPPSARVCVLRRASGVSASSAIGWQVALRVTQTAQRAVRRRTLVAGRGLTRAFMEGSHRFDWKPARRRSQCDRRFFDRTGTTR
jgi:hypothetical protein